MWTIWLHLEKMSFGLVGEIYSLLLRLKTSSIQIVLLANFFFFFFLTVEWHPHFSLNFLYYLPINRKLFISMPLFRSMSERQQQCYWVRYKILVLHLLGACEMFMYSISEHVCTCPSIPQEHWGMALEFVFIHDHLIFYLLLLCKYLNQL